MTHLRVTILFIGLIGALCAFAGVWEAALLECGFIFFVFLTNA